ncbi:MAG: hypothetical protein HYY93_11660 [Planctomycetes bacterium]|nr:hypothetical protein [Planctomycetota bacterium]
MAPNQPEAQDAGGAVVSTDPPIAGRAFSVTMGIALGLLVSVTPLSGVEPISLAFLVVLYAGFRWALGRPSARERRRLLLGTALATVVVCYRLPVKILDRSIPPLNYPRMSLADLSSRLYSDHHLRCRVYDDEAREEMIQFSTDRALSQREVMERLASETGRELNISYCGTMGGSILFGGYPSFTTLRPRRASGRGGR